MLNTNEVPAMYTQHSIKYWNAAPKEREKFTKHSFKLISNASWASHGSNSSDRRPWSPTIDSTSKKSHFSEVELQTQSIETELSSTSFSTCETCAGSCRESCELSARKKVSFGSVEIREHPRILGDNPVPKDGLSLSIGWFQPNRGRHITHTVDDFEAERSLTRRPKQKSLVLSSKARKRILKEQANVSSRDIRAARKEATYIRKSRIANNLWLYREMEPVAIALESLTKPVRELLAGSLSERELRELMIAASRADRAKKSHRSE